jgi:hypothetical protein
MSKRKIGNRDNNTNTRAHDPQRRQLVAKAVSLAAYTKPTIMAPSFAQSVRAQLPSPPDPPATDSAGTSQYDRDRRRDEPDSHR